MIGRLLRPVFLLLGIFSVMDQTGRSVAEGAAAPVKIMASYGGELGYQAPLWVAHDLKLFAKQGISSELIRIAGGSRSMATLLSNSIHVAQSAGVSTVQADLVGGDVVIVATSTNRATVGIVAQPKTIKKPQDLAGKTVGLVGRGDMNEYFFLNALERWGIDPKSITFLAIPGSQPRLVAVANGNIDATILAPPFTFEAEKMHLTTLVDFTTSSDPFPQSGLVVRKEYLRTSRDTVKKILMAYIEAIYILKKDAEKSTAIMKKYMRITDDAIAKRSFEYYSKLFSQPPLTEERGIGVVLKFLATQPEFPKAKNAKATDFFDNSLLLELQREGYLARFK